MLIAKWFKLLCLFSFANTGRIVPMFAINNKKKRSRQALYANPTTEDFEDSSSSFSSAPSLDSFILNHRDECFDGSGTGLSRKSVPRLQEPDSLNNKVNATNSFSSGSYKLTGTNRGGVQVRQPKKQDSHPFRNYSVDSPPTKYTTISHNAARFVLSLFSFCGFTVAPIVSLSSQ